jgi:hypothetical protein
VSYGSAPNARYAFRVVDDRGETVRDFGVEHERRMHLIVVRRDFGSFQHVHPRQLADGSWEVDLDLSDAGTYRVFADFTTGETDQVVSSDIHVAGDFSPVPAQPVSDHASAGDGYEVTLSSPTPRAGTTSPAEFTVTRNGRELDAVEPYLGADGHLVALSEADLEYLHTHPEGKPGGSGPITFDVEYPSPGRYRLYLQFKHDGKVHTAPFTQEVTGSVTGEASGGHEEDGNGHG